MKIKLLGTTLEMEAEELTNPDIAKKYEDGVEKAIEKIAEAEKESVGSEGVRKQCQAVIEAFEEMFGEKDTRKVLGEKTNLFRCLDAFDEYVGLYPNTIVPEIDKKFEELNQAIVNTQIALL